MNSEEVDVNRDLDCKFPICFALRNVDCTVECVRMLVDAGFPAGGVVDQRNNLTALHEAVKRSDLAMVEYLCCLSINVSPKDNNGKTPLHYAVEGENINIIKVLVINGADLETACDKDFTPLFYAMADINYEAVAALLSLGADFDRIWNNGHLSSSPLHFAVRNLDLEMIKLLLNEGANVNIVIPETGQTVLHLALDKTKVAVLSKLVVTLLVESGANVNAKDQAGTTVLELAIRHNCYFAVELFIENNLSLNTDGAFLKIVQSRDRHIIRLCLQYGGDYLMKTNQGEFLLNSILSPGFIAAVISCGLRYTPTNQTLKAVTSIFCSIVKLFWRSGFPVEYTVMELELWKEVTYMKGLAGCIMQRISSQKKLFKGVQKYNARMVKDAINDGADVRTCSVDVPFPIHYLAAKRGDTTCLQLYLSRSVNVNMLDAEGRTALQVAAMNGNDKCCELLLEKGAVYNATTAKCPETAYQLAKSREQIHVVKLLGKVASVFQSLKKDGKLKKLTPLKAIMNCRDRSGKTLLETALEHGNVSIVEKLLKLRLKRLK